MAKQPLRLLKLRMRRCCLLRAARKRNGFRDTSPSIFKRLATKDFYVQKFRSMKSSFMEEEEEPEVVVAEDQISVKQKLAIVSERSVEDSVDE